MQWRIAAHGCFESVAGETATDLREPLKAVVANRPRRINRYTQLALIGAHRCVEELTSPLPSRTPLYLASEQGNVAEAVSLMDGIVRHGQVPKPMSFVNVSSNMAGFYLGASLGLSGRNMTVARQGGSFGAMLEMAALDPARDAPMLLGSVSECVWPLADHRQRHELAADAELVEGSYWLLAAAAGDGDDDGARLDYTTTRDPGIARDWLASGSYWACDPHLPVDARESLQAALEPDRAWRVPLAHRGHPDALAHCLFTALASQPIPELRLVAGDPAQGYQLISVGS